VTPHPGSGSTGDAEASGAAELAGSLGLAWLDVYERDRDADALNAGLTRLHEAIDAAPNHPDRATWLFGLGIAHCARADLEDRADDYDRAIDYLSGLDARTAAALDQDEIAGLMVDAYWERYWLRQGEVGDDRRQAVDETRTLVATLEALAADRRSSYGLMMAGVSRLRLYEIERARVDLDRGIEILGAALRDPPSDTPRLGFAGACLADAYRERSMLDEDLASLALSIGTGKRALGWSGDGDPASRRMAHETLAIAYGGRWRIVGDRADLDRAVASWRAVGPTPLDAWQAGEWGDLLRERAELDGSRADAAEAVALLGASTDMTPDAHGAWQRWYSLGRAHQAAWRLGQVPGSLERAIRCLDRATLLDGPDDDERLSLYSDLLDAAGEAYLRDHGLPPGETRVSAERYVQALARGRIALARARDADPDLRSRLALTLAWAEMGFNDPDYGEFDPGRVRGLLDLAARRPHPPPGWSGLVDLCHGVWTSLIGGSVPNPWGDDGVAELARALATEGMDDEIRERVRQILPVAAQLSGLRSGSLRVRDAAEALLRDHDQAPRTGSGAPESDASVLAAIFGAMDIGLGHDLEAFIGMSDVASQAMAQLPPPDRRGGTLVSLVRSVKQLAAALRGESPEAPADHARPLPAPGEHVDEAELSRRLVEVLSQAVGALAHNDSERVRRATTDLEVLVERTSDGSLLRLGATGALGQIYLESARRDVSDQPAAHQAERWFAEAARAARGPEHPQWPPIALGLAEASRRADNADPAGSRALGISALAAHGLRVLLQAGTDYAIEAARAASADAARVAGWCWQDHAYDELVAALDASRGLVLRAATLSRRVADRLTTLGRHDLAAEWRATAGLGRDQFSRRVLGDRPAGLEVPDDLRRRVLAVLTGAGVDAGLTETVEVTDVREGLTALGADALVYLVAAAPTHPGLAVVVTPQRQVDVVELPGLTVDPDGPVRRHARSGVGSRDLEPWEPDEDGPWERRLDDLCQWAWRSAMSDLVNHVRRWRLARPARIVMVPMGMLGLVPWHAAYTVDGSTRRYAVADITVSYIPSARMLCEAARHVNRPIRSVLIVGDPRGDLNFAGIEARAIRAAFYPHGTYLGHPREDSAGAGTPDQVRAWVTAAQGPSLLHLACHARSDPKRPSGANLSLAGGALSAADLVEATRLSKLTIERVFLAACTTNTAGEDYDEAFSLATVFLAAGAHTVFGSLWPVSDMQTSLLMFMVHYYLNIEVKDPMDALHAAQQWMIDPHRQPPSAMPAALTAHARRPELSHPVAWAAFTHLGR
jgi:tetratricopeptide (TPR) repeat protein